MIDINILRENPEKVKENLKKKFQDEKLPLVDEILKLDSKWRKLKYDEDKFRSERNKISKSISEEIKNGNKKEAEKLKEEAKEIPEKIGSSEVKRKKLEVKIKESLMRIPNFINDLVPIGKSDKENVEVKRIGEPKVPSYEVFNHAELAEKLGGADFDTARKTSGNGFYYLMGDISRLHSALISYAKDYMIKEGFEFVIPPFLIRSEVVEGVMSFEEKDNMMYKIEGEDLYLIGTSEHSLIGMFSGKTVNGKNLPYKITGVSPCFRKEVGAHGIEEKGFYRVHQFEKQEMIVICDPSESEKWYEKMLELSVELFKEVGIPVRILECCSGDLADLKSRSADVEAWSPRQKKYFEVGSCSNLTDAQARRLNIRAEKNGKIYLVHTLNNTVIASPRALIAVMENFQEKDGSIAIPKVLQPYMGGKKKIEVKE
ncbi:MAG: serine--tRNA ligase [Nanoarchaeota archaeon]|nr:serine--tRNA ligase [Nanoarchaeota archaeon]